MFHLVRTLSTKIDLLTVTLKPTEISVTVYHEGGQTVETGLIQNGTTHQIVYASALQVEIETRLIRGGIILQTALVSVH